MNEHTSKQRAAGLLQAFASDRRGSVVAFVALGFLFIVAGLLALSVNHGVNLTQQSDVDARLHACTKYAGKMYIAQRIDNAACTIAPDVCDEWPKNGVYSSHLHAGDDEPQARSKLKNYVRDCIQEKGLTGSGGVSDLNKNTTVDTPSLEVNANGQYYLHFKTSSPQSQQFAIWKGKEQGTTRNESGVLLPLYGMGFPIPESSNNSTAFVVSLDQNSKDKLGDFMTKNITTIADVLTSFNAAGQQLASQTKVGVQVGNMPVAAGEVYDRTQLATSGCAYDNVNDIKFSMQKETKATQHNTQPLWAELQAQHTRRCNASKAIWTYQSRVVKHCKGKRIGSCSRGPGGQGTCGTNYLVGDPSPGSDSCECWEKKPVYQGVFFAACPHSEGGKNLMSRDEIYQPAGQFLTLQAKLWGDYEANELKGSSGRPKRRLEGKPALAGPFPQGASGKLQGDELMPLRARNTEKSWVHGCDSRYMGKKGFGGEYGLPYGSLVGRPLAPHKDYNPASSDAYKYNACGDVPEPPYPSNGYYKTVMNPEGCSGTEVTGCDNWEGLYFWRVLIEGLKPRMSPEPGNPGSDANFAENLSGLATPDNSPGWAIAGDGGHWANAKNIPDGDPCPPNENPSGLAPYSVGHVIEKDFVPEEYLKVSSVAVEGEWTDAFARNYEIVDNFDAKNYPDVPGWDKGVPSAQTLLAEKNIVKRGNSFDEGACPDYPFFCKTTETSILEQKVNPNDMPNHGLLWATSETSGLYNIGYGKKDEAKLVKYYNAEGDVAPHAASASYAKGCIKIPGDLKFRQNLAPGSMQSAIDYLKGLDYGGVFSSGHNGNQCALLSSVCKLMMGACGGSGSNMVIYVGAAPSDSDNIQDVNWYAFSNGNPPGEIGEASQLHLKEVNTLVKSGICSKTRQCFEDFHTKTGVALYLITDETLNGGQSTSACLASSGGLPGLSGGGGGSDMLSTGVCAKNDPSIPAKVKDRYCGTQALQATMYNAVYSEAL